MSHLEHGSRGLEGDVGDGGDEDEEDPEDDHGEDALRLERLQLLRHEHLDAVRQPRHDVLRRVLQGKERSEISSCKMSSCHLVHV